MIEPLKNSVRHLCVQLYLYRTSPPPPTTTTTATSAKKAQKNGHSLCLFVGAKIGFYVEKWTKPQQNSKCFYDQADHQI